MTDPLQTALPETAPLRDTLEKRRQIYWQIFVMAVPMVFAALCAIFAAGADHDRSFPWIGILIMTALLALAGYCALNMLYLRQTKKAFLELLAARLGFQYHPDGAFPVEDFHDHTILPAYSIARCEDGFTGTINGVALAFQEVRLLEKTRTNNKETIRETFSGLLIKITLGKTLRGHTIAMSNTIAARLFFHANFSGLEKVNLVSPRFAEKFNVAGTDQVEARYILDPAFMENFQTIGDVLQTPWINASFKNRDLAIAARTMRPLFEIGILHRPLTEAQIEKAFNDITMLTRLIETLKLNPYTGLGAELPTQ